MREINKGNNCLRMKDRRKDQGKQEKGRERQRERERETERERAGRERERENWVIIMLINILLIPPSGELASMEEC